MAFTLVSTVEVGSGGAASISWNNIPQNGKDLLVVFSLSSNSGSNYNDLEWTVNGSTSNLSSAFVQWNGTTVYQGANLFPSGRGIGYGSGESSYFTNGQLYVSEYTASTNKSYEITSTFGASGTPGGNLISGLWSNTAAITSLLIKYNSNNLRQYSTASLYIIS